MAKVQDIHISDKSLYNQFVNYWNNGNYANAISLFNTNLSQLGSKGFTAQNINDIIDLLIDLQNNDDPTFKTEKIQFSPSPPAGMTSGQIYFKII